MRVTRDSIIRAVTIALFLAIPLLIAIVDQDWVNDRPTLCLHKRFTGEDCMGCGLTRAMVALMHGHLGEALTFNRGIVIAAPVLGALWLRELHRHARALLQGSPRAAKERLNP
jgi:hypothetical protein